MIAFFVAAKFSFTRLRQWDSDEMEMEGWRLETLKKMYEDPTLYMNTMQFYIVFFTMIVGALMVPGTKLFISSVVSEIGISEHTEIILGNIIAFTLAAVITLTIGEVVPKAIALSFPQQAFAYTVKYTRFLSYLAKPCSWFSVSVAKLLLKNSEAKVMTEIDLVHTEDEIRTMIDHSHKQGAIDKTESELIDNVFDFVDRITKEVMVPRQDVVCVFADEDYETNREIIVKSKHTRYPLAVEDKDHIIGLIHVKDFLEKEDEARKDLRSIKRDIFIVPEVMKLPVLLQNMRSHRIYQSVVVDEYGGMVGLVGLQDIVEELVGDIKDEHEEAKEQVVHLPDGGFDFDGSILTDDVENIMDIELVDCEEDTLAGYIFAILSKSPEVGDSITVSGYTFTVTEVQGYRITRVVAHPVPEEERTHEESDSENEKA